MSEVCSTGKVLMESKELFQMKEPGSLQISSPLKG